jgi:2-oxoglutarate dehydrogenase E2 component (dihydrolipoamide succinyltransferase)
MSIEVRVPDLGESISEVEVSGWLVRPGEAVALDAPVIELESDKATVEVPAPAAGVVVEITAEVGAVLKTGDVLARIDENAEAPAVAPVEEPDAEPVAEAAESQADKPAVMPAAKRAMEERGIAADQVAGSGPGGRILKEDVPASAAPPAAPTAAPTPKPSAPSGERVVRRVRMSPIRRRIAERLVESQSNAALLTTFQEFDMSRIKALRAEHQEAFTAKYGVKLGFMSFFVKAAVEALREVPELNAQIDGKEIVHHDYCDVGIAVGGGKGLVVPVIRNAELLDFGELEQTIGDFARRAAENKIELAELEGGTFTISNGGVYGSLMSTPIINPPQSGVLGLHAIEDRPVVVDGEIAVRPMMYAALTYDHRLVDGREAVTFLRHVKLCVEQPERLLLKV